MLFACVFLQTQSNITKQLRGPPEAAKYPASLFFFFFFFLFISSSSFFDRF